MLQEKSWHIRSCVSFQMRAVEDDRNRVADKLNATEAAGYSFMADKLAHLEAQLATKDWQLQTERAGASR